MAKTADQAMRPTLNELGIKHQTDKASTHHGYLSHYEEIFGPMRDEAFDLLEIGLLNGASARLWHDYFTQARIVGVDVKPVQVYGDLPRFTFVQGSQTDPVLLNELAGCYRFRIVIDDGSHLWGHQIFTFQTLFPLMASGGIYICEDIQTSFGSYVERYSGGAAESAASYFLRIAERVAAGKAEPLKESQDPLLHRIVSQAASVQFIKHCVIVRAK